MNKSRNEWIIMNEWLTAITAWLNKMNEWMNAMKCIYEMNEWMNEWTHFHHYAKSFKVIKFKESQLRVFFFLIDHSVLLHSNFAVLKNLKPEIVFNWNKTKIAYNFVEKTNCFVLFSVCLFVCFFFLLKALSWEIDLLDQRYM